MAHQQGQWRPYRPWRRCRPWRLPLQRRRCRPCHPSLRLSQQRLHAHKLAPCARLPYMGAVTTGYAQIATGPLPQSPTRSTAARRVPTINRGSTDPKSVQQAVWASQATRRMSAQRRYLVCQLHQLGPWHLPHPAPCSSSWARGTCPHCDAHPRNDRKGADVFAWERRANPVPVAQRGKACRIGVWLAAAARPKYRILTCCALDALSSCKCALTPESRQRIAALVLRGKYDRCYSETTHTQCSTTAALGEIAERATAV
jgi:hypothetical protein